MKKDTLFQKLLEHFQKWYDSDPHSKNLNYYKSILTKQNLQSIADDELVGFFYDFIADGGLVQSGGDRTKNKFRRSTKRNIDAFRTFVLEPFNNGFELSDWFARIDDHKNFGIGIATIYLNRVDRGRYSIMNNKTLNALRQLGYNLSSTKNFKNYEKVNEIQNQLLTKYPQLENLYKIDALNHFIIATQKGKEILREFQYIETIENNLEQTEITTDETIGINEFDSDVLLQSILENENEKAEEIIVNGKRIKRHNYLMVLIKKYRGYKCQFCSTTILKKNGEYYIEACHIKAKADGGKDSLNNIIVLCPNCHKLFDLAERKDAKHTSDYYHVTLNKKRYKAKIK